MDKNSSAKLTTKKSQMTSEKPKKSASKKKKKSKKSSSKNQSPDSLEVEGIRALDQNGVESDSSASRAQIVTSPAPSQKSSVTVETDLPSRVQSERSPPLQNDIVSKPKPKSASNAHKLSSDVAELLPIKTIQSATSVVVSDKDSGKKPAVTFSNYEQVQKIPATLSTMSVKSKNGSQRNKTKNSSKSVTNGATRREKTRTEQTKSCINKAAEAAARLKSEESLRWEFTLEDDEQEQERIRIYKMNRRKRYLAAAQEKGLGWVVNYGMNGTPLPEDSSTSLNLSEVHSTTVNDFTSVRNIMVTQSSTPLGMGTEIAC